MNWAINEVKYMDFNDKRLNKRAEKMLESFSENPTGSIPEACETNAATIGAYRFFDNEKVTSKKIFKGFNEATKNRMANKKEILFISDSTSYVFTGRKTLDGIGVLRNFKARGYIMHSTFVASSGIGLGLIHQDLWGRKPEDYGKRKQRSKLPVEEKESFKWIEHMRASQLSLEDDQHGIYICDRDADMLDLFAESRQSNFDILVRSNHNRRIAESNLKLQEILNNEKVMGETKILIKRSGERKERESILELKYKKVTLVSSKNSNYKITLNVVEAKEKITSADIKDPIYWRLFTTMEITCLQDAILCINLYNQSWLIERFHYALKSGCQIEELQLESQARMFSAIAMYCIIAWRIMSICYSARHEPDKPADCFFTIHELESLHCFYNKTNEPPQTIPSIKEAVYMLAKLGGFLGRKSDGIPGMKVLWRGLRRLEGFVEAYILFNSNLKRCV